MSALAAEFPREAFEHRIRLDRPESPMPTTLLAAALAAYSNAQTQIAALKRENQMLWNSIAARDEAQP